MEKMSPGLTLATEEDSLSFLPGETRKHVKKLRMGGNGRWTDEEH